MSAKKSKKRSSNNSVRPAKVSRASSTPFWVRAVIILIAITFIGGSIVFVAGGAGSSAPTAVSASAAIDDVYQALVDDALEALGADATDPQLHADVANAYYNWAVALYEEGRQAEAAQYWIVAVSYYNQSLEIAPDNPAVLYAKALALCYAGSTDAEAALTIFIESSKESTTYAEQVSTAKALLASIQSLETTGSSD